VNTIKFVFLTFVIGIIFGLFSCSHKSTTGGKKPKLKYAPPGTNHLFGKIFIDEAEVTNLSWREYMYWTKRVYGDSSPEFNATLPDTLVWNNCYSDFANTKQYCANIQNMKVVYLRYAQFSHFPVVGISLEQAKRFCAWRTNRVNEVYYVNEHKEVTFPIDSSHVIPKRVNFRIPSEEEWEFAAKAGFDTSRFINNDYKLNFNTSESAALRMVAEDYEKFIPMKDFSLQPDKYNRYHLYGNVAEMIDKKGVAKGGSYIHSTSDSYYTKRIHYSKPEYWLGFRCVCEVLEEKK
jgi:formylglycine-generating enzyme required for sulfatase activity